MNPVPDLPIVLIHNHELFFDLYKAIKEFNESIKNQADTNFSLWFFRFVMDYIRTYYLNQSKILSNPDIEIVDIVNFRLCKTNEYQLYLQSYVMWMFFQYSEPQIYQFFKGTVGLSSIHKIILFYQNFLESELYRFLFEGTNYEFDYPVDIIVINQKSGTIHLDISKYYSKLHTKGWSLRKSCFLYLYNVYYPTKILPIKIYFNSKVRMIEISVVVMNTKSMLLSDVVGHLFEHPLVY